MLRTMSPHAVIAVISGRIPDEISTEVASCIDVLMDKPVPLATFTRLLEGVGQIGNALDQIRLLGQVPSKIR